MVSNILIAYCPYCGKVNCIAHSKYVDRCEECGKRYHKYASYKSQQKNNPNWKRERKLEEIRLEYKDLKRLGFKVPKDIE